jgi:hypothetical protein
VNEKPKLIISDPLVKQMIAAGLLSEYCTEFILHAKCGEPIRLYETKFVTDVILDLASRIEETKDPGEARV